MRAFLSHSSADRDLATTIYRSLRDQALPVWFDRLELQPGDSLLKKIVEGISESDYLLALVTDESKNSAWVEKEITIALTQEIHGTGPKVIPWGRKTGSIRHATIELTCGETHEPGRSKPKSSGRHLPRGKSLQQKGGALMACEGVGSIHRNSTRRTGKPSTGGRD